MGVRSGSWTGGHPPELSDGTKERRVPPRQVVLEHVCPLGPGPGKVIIWKTNFTLMASPIWMSKMFSEARPPVSSVNFLTCY